MLGRALKLLALPAVFTLAMAGSVSADTKYPDRPMTLMVAYGPGGATDFQARIATMNAIKENYLGQPIAIINKPGAGGRVAFNWFKKEAATDGYTLGTYNVPHFIAQSIEGGVSYSADDFEPIANWGADPAVFVVSKDSKFNTMQEVLDYAKKNPGKFTFSGAGLYVGHHIAALQIQKAADVKLAYIPNSAGAVGALKSVIAGEVMGGVNNVSDAFRAQKAGNVKILAIAHLKRSPFLPDVPTMKELGFDVDNSSVQYRGIMVRKGTSEEHIKFLADRVYKMFQDPNVKDKMEAGGAALEVMNREEVQAMWKKRQETLKELLAGL